MHTRREARGQFHGSSCVEVLFYVLNDEGNLPRFNSKGTLDAPKARSKAVINPNKFQQEELQSPR